MDNSRTLFDGLTSYKKDKIYRTSNDRKTRKKSISEDNIEDKLEDDKENVLNNRVIANDVQLTIKLQTELQPEQTTKLTSNLKIESSNKLTTHLISKFRPKFRTSKTNHQNNDYKPLDINDLQIRCNQMNDRVAGQLTKNSLLSSNSFTRRSNYLFYQIISLIAIILISNHNQIYAKLTSDEKALSNQQSALFFTNNLPFKIAFYNTTGTVLNCPISGVPKPIIHWLAVGRSHSNLNLNNLNNKVNYRYSYNFVNQNWPINGQYRNNYEQQSITSNQPNQNLIENILASNPDLSPVVDLHNVIYTRNDGALVFPPFYANDLQPNVHNRKYRCLAINEHGALISNEIQIKARKSFC